MIYLRNNMIYNGHKLPDIGDELYVITHAKSGEIRLAHGPVVDLAVSLAAFDLDAPQNGKISFGGTIRSDDIQDSIRMHYCFTDGTYATTEEKAKELLRLFQERGFIADTSNMMNLIVHGATFGDRTPVPRRNLRDPGTTSVKAPVDYEYLLKFTLIRYKKSIKEAWADIFMMPLDVDEYEKIRLAPQHASSAAKEVILSRIQAWLASKRGWATICPIGFKYNWGDAVKDGSLEEACGCVDGNFPAANIVELTITVDQDEHIAPDNIQVRLEGFKEGFDKPFFSADDVMLDMAHGYLSNFFIFYDIRADEMDSAFVVLPNGDRIECDREQGFLCLKEIL